MSLPKHVEHIGTVEAWRQKELVPVCTEDPVTIYHVKVDYRFLIHPIMPLQKLNLKKKCVYKLSPVRGFNSLYIQSKDQDSGKL